MSRAIDVAIIAGALSGLAPTSPFSAYSYAQRIQLTLEGLGVASIDSGRGRSGLFDLISRTKSTAALDVV